MKLEIIPLKTRKVLPPQDDITDILKHLPKLHKGDVLVIASKILAIHQGRTIKIGDADKAWLIKKEADYYLPPHLVKKSEIISDVFD